MSRFFALLRAVVIAPLFLALWLWLIPRLIGGSRVFTDSRPPGWILVAVGALIGLPCVWEFAWRGFGTPAPFDPPRKLVISGPYRFVRNPMYVGLALVMVGFAVTFPHALWIFLGEVAFAAVAVSIMVVRYEEPALRKLFGAEYDDYCRHVPRWLPRVTPFDKAADGA